MRNSIKNYMEEAKRRREETGESGFSLIELIIVIVVIGILAAIAIPIFAGIQKNANDAAAQSAAANGATSAAILASQVPDALTATTAFPDLQEGNVSVVVTTAYTAGDISSICVTSTYSGGNFAKWSEGPGCTTQGGHA